MDPGGEVSASVALLPVGEAVVTGGAWERWWLTRTMLTTGTVMAATVAATAIETVRQVPWFLLRLITARSTRSVRISSARS